MASYGNAAPMAAPRHGQQQHAAYGAPVAMQAPAAPHGTFSPGTKIQVGEHRVVIQKYLSEGGFAHVYLVKLPRPVDGTDLAVLKRVAVPDRDTLRGMRTEVETMKRLKGHRPIVTYIDSHASEMKGGGYEVFLLMEFCDGGGLIDFMNTRLQHRLTEPEILNIFTDVTEGVACMHYLKPPLLHRDLKVENVLITMVGQRRKFKLCDFGSAANPKPAPQTVVECRLMDEDVQRHTTLQYRSPEMIDVYRKQPIDEKSDIWALGVLLYKLCYYTTPFEDQGQLAILNASFKFPSYPVFSDRLKHLIASMLREHQQARPNVYQVLKEGLRMQGREIHIPDIYATRPQAESSKPNGPLPDPGGKHTPVVGAVFSPPPQQQQVIPEVAPMRRGRLPAATNQPPPQPAAKPSPSPLRVTSGDPFAALDANTAAAKPADVDEVAASPTSPAGPKGFEQQVAQKLADDAFAKPAAVPASSGATQSRVKSMAAANELDRTSSPRGSSNKPAAAPPKPAGQMSRASAIINNNPELQAIASPPLPATQSPSSRPNMGYVSTGTMTSTPPQLDLPTREYPPIYRFPSSDDARSSSVPRQGTPSQLRADTGQSSRPIAAQRIHSFQSPALHGRQPSSSRPSLEGGRPSADFMEPLSKTNSLVGRPRPASTYLESNLDYLREKETAPKPMRSPGLPSMQFENKASPSLEPQDDATIESNVDFLRSMEEADNRKKDKASKHGKRNSSLGSLSGKNIFAGKFGDAFKRFEAKDSSFQPARTPSPLRDAEQHDLNMPLTPIAGSEATDGRSDDGRMLGDQEELTPEQRRDLEAQALAEEERRVEAAAAEYRQRMAAREMGGSGAASAPLPKSIGGVSRAVSIQNRVQNLLEESQKVAPPQRTAEGYGRFTDTQQAAARDKTHPDLPPKPANISTTGGRAGPPAKPATSSSDAMARRQPTGTAGSESPASSSAAPARPLVPTHTKPSAPPKPSHLNKLPTGSSGRKSPSKPRPNVSSTDLIDMTPQEKDDYMQDFSKRFPSLGAIEMVERDIGDDAGGRR
ncbi:Serine/threonine-protein kinase [Apiospora aurea]|uniref:non-specific serine/threonine protein kinase n=1 Tax=Apiospora aurea TaxID=335848 RepID=A0ABR1QFH3_9PEZI